MSHHYPHAPLWRRLFALLYDSLLLVALLFLATLILLPFTQSYIEAGNPFYRMYLFLVICGFYLWFWLHGGQTLGMRAWRLQIQALDNSKNPIKLYQALLRLSCACLSFLCFGLGFIWSLVDPNKLTWHDYCSQTVLIVLPKT